MENWNKILRCDPIPAFLAAEDAALAYFVRRDLLGEAVGTVDQLWGLPEPGKILKKQLPDGSWPRAGEDKHPAINYGLIETWRYFRILVEQYGFTREHPRARLAAEYLFACQTDAGDFRGFLANQYATYYSGAILGLLIEAGYASDPRVEKGLAWLLSMRQDDGGWTIPVLTHKMDGKTLYRLTSEHTEALEPVRSMPFSHNWTGMALRGFAAYPTYRKSDAAVHAAELLVSRFFQPDAYTSYQDAGYWVRFDYPFWWNNLVSALDTVARIGLTKDHPQVAAGLAWLVEHQRADGLWNVTYTKAERENTKTGDKRLWISLAICRVFRRLCG